MRMKLAKIAFTAAMMLATALAISCSSDGGGGSNPIKKAKITGVSQKGPFVKGSSATLYELNEAFAQTGRSFRDIIADDYGKFEIKNVELASPYAMLEADGFYRNEVTGQISAAPIKLYAIADIREKDNVNVNLLTHLEYYRVLNLVENNGKSVAEAKKQAQKEILAVFGISGEFENSEDMSIFGTSEGDAALLAISVLLQGDLSEGEFSQRLTDFAQSIRESGKWDNETAKTDMADWSNAVSFSNRDSVMKFCKYDNNSWNCHPMPTNDMCMSGVLVDYCEDIRELIPSSKFIRSNILTWGLSSEVPDFGKYIRNYGLYELGKCDTSNEDELKFVSGNLWWGWFVCRNNEWSSPTTLELLLSGKFECSNEGTYSYFYYGDGDDEYSRVVCKEGFWQVYEE